MRRPDDSFMRDVRALESEYLTHSDPIRQSGFGGGPERWRLEREPILDAMERDGSLLDVGCANGHLAFCLAEWGAERGLTIEPHGVDIGPRLVALARGRRPDLGSNFHVGDVWTWEPHRSYDYVYCLVDVAPPEMTGKLVDRLLGWVEGGRVILGDYGSRSRAVSPLDVAGLLAGQGYDVAGATAGGDPPITRFAWLESR